MRINTWSGHSPRAARRRIDAQARRWSDHQHLFGRLAVSVSGDRRLFDERRSRRCTSPSRWPSSGARTRSAWCVISPSLTRTELAQEFVEFIENSDNVTLNPLNNRICEPEEVAALCLFVASPRGLLRERLQLRGRRGMRDPGAGPGHRVGAAARERSARSIHRSAGAVPLLQEGAALVCQEAAADRYRVPGQGEDLFGALRELTKAGSLGDRGSRLRSGPRLRRRRRARLHTWGRARRSSRRSRPRDGAHRVRGSRRGWPRSRRGLSDPRRRRRGCAPPRESRPRARSHSPRVPVRVRFPPGSSRSRAASGLRASHPEFCKSAARLRARASTTLVVGSRWAWDTGAPKSAEEA